jgi:ribosome-associated toxin RatA of RatAB toxin-antitoxin module
MKSIARSALVEHAAAEMYALVDDIEAYPRFLPWCLEARVQQAGARKRATLTVGVSGIRQTFTTENENQPERAIDMRLVEGPFRAFSAAWRFTPLGERACQIEYSMRYQFASRTLARLLEPLFNQIADTMVDAFTRRADELDPR